jgi:hypothetical protein
VVVVAVGTSSYALRQSHSGPVRLVLLQSDGWVSVVVVSSMVVLTFLLLARALILLLL